MANSESSKRPSFRRWVIVIVGVLLGLSVLLVLGFLLFMFVLRFYAHGD